RCESDPLLEEDGAKPPADQAGGDREGDARKPRAPGRDAEEPEASRGEPDDQRRLVEEWLPGEVERPPVAAGKNRPRGRGVDHRVTDEVALGEPAAQGRGGEEGE